MNLTLLLSTVRYLKLTQVIFQIRNRFLKYQYHVLKNQNDSRFLDCDSFLLKPTCYDNKTFQFLNLKSSISTWNETGNGMLWAYNLNYMDWLLQENMTFKEGANWINRFIEEIPTNKVGLDPYPIALRGINWIKFFSQHANSISTTDKKKWNDSLYSQYCLLTKKLEYHLLGNHLLEDAYSLFIASLHFNDKHFYKKSTAILKQELDEEILADGAHYEQSPMYHCILLDRLLDCYNFSIHNPRFPNQEEITSYLKRKAILMLGHLENIVYSDGYVPLLNDSAYGIAPTASDIFNYAKRLGLEWQAIPLSKCGYRKFRNKKFECVMDVGNILASYQPGHSHADTFNYELRINGMPFIVDTGISTYNKTERRHYERSTAAHNTVTIDGHNSSDVWGGFRIGNRAKVKLLVDKPGELSALHDGFGRKHLHKRTFKISESSFYYLDEVSHGQAVSYIHFAPEVDILFYSNHIIETNKGRVSFEGALSIEIMDEKISNSYNTFSDIKVAKIFFENQLHCRIE